MKKIACALVLASAFITSTASAKMEMTHQGQEPITSNYFSGKITFAYYNCSYSNNTCTTYRGVTISVQGKDKKSVNITFTERDLALGAALMNSVGKSVSIGLIEGTTEVSNISLTSSFSEE